MSSIFQGISGTRPPENLVSFELEDGTQILDQDHVASASLEVQPDPAGTQAYLVVITLDEEGKEKFAQATADHIGEVINIRVNGEIVSAPVVQEPITGGSCVISGVTWEEAESLAEQLN